MISWPDEVVNDIARRKCVLYLGSGVSANSKSADGTKHPATWDAFLRSIKDKRAVELREQLGIICELIDKKDYLLACEIIIAQLGNRDFGELAADEFRRPGFQPSIIHDVIYGLDSRIVITPNIDKIYEQCANTSSYATVVTKKYYDDIAPFLRQPDYLIIKAHGCVDDPQNIVFTHEQYNRVRYQYASFYRLLDALLLTNTFIFIGCGINDPDIQLNLENWNFSFPNCKPHYFITANGSINEEIAKSLQKNRNIKVLTYDNTDGSHNELLSELKALSQLIELKRQEYASNATW
ncbi:hypothetical protein JCM15765_40100 [Paradesulfitobacterium aromaticivorans]